MFLVSYDISNDKLRTKFSKFLKKYGVPVQYSVYRIKNSKRLLDIIANEVDIVYKKQFKQTDSVYIFRICEGCQKNIKKYGYAVFEEQDTIKL